MAEYISTPFGVLRKPLSSFANTITAIAGVVGITIAVSTANQTAIVVKDYAGRPSFQVTGSGALTASGAMRLSNYNCKGRTNSGKLTTDAFGNVLCGDDISGGGGASTSTGNVITIGDSRYVKKSGDTMTGALLVKANLSGSQLIVSNNASVSGALTVLNRAGTNTGNIFVLDSKGLVYDATTKRVGIGTSSPVSTLNPDFGIRSAAFNAGTASWQDLTLTNASTALNSTVGIAMNLGTYNANGGVGIAAVKSVSASDKAADLVFVTRPTAAASLERMRITASGSVGIGTTSPAVKLDVKGTISGSMIVTRGTFSGSNLALSGNANLSGTLLVKGNAKFLANLSGTNLIVGNNATVSGTLVLQKKAGTSTGNILVVDTKGIIYDATNKRMGVGITTPQRTIDISSAEPLVRLSPTDAEKWEFGAGNGTVFGTGTYTIRNASVGGAPFILRGSKQNAMFLSSTNFWGLGTLNPGSNLTVSGSVFIGRALGSVANTTAGSSLAVSGAIIAGKMVATTAADAGVSIESLQILSGANLTISGGASITGSLLVKNNITARGILSGANLVVSAGASVSGSLIVGNKISAKAALSGQSLNIMGVNSYIIGSLRVGDSAAPKARVDVNGTLSGTDLTISQSASITGTLLVGNNVSTRGTFSGAGLKIMGATSYILANLRVGDSAAAKAKLDVNGTLSGTNLTVSQSASITGTLLVKGNTTWRGAGSGQSLTLLSPLLQTYGGTALKDFAYKDIILSAGGGLPSTTSGSVAKTVTFGTNGISISTQDFTGSGGSPRYVQWSTTMPQSYNGGTMTGSVKWTSVTSNGRLKFFIQCVGIGTGGTIDTAWGTARSMTGFIVAGNSNKLQTTSVSGPITCGGTPAGGNEMFFRLYRDPSDGNDILQGTGRLLQALVRYKTNSFSD